MDLEVIQQEFTTNYLSYLSLTKAFLPSFPTKQEARDSMHIVSGNGPSRGEVKLLRWVVIEAQHLVWVWCLCLDVQTVGLPKLRSKLKGSNIKVVEIFPPAVQSMLPTEAAQEHPLTFNSRAT